MNLDAAIVYDIETLPNCFSLNAQGLFSDLDVTFEISHFRDDRALLFQWFDYWRDNEVPMISFNGIAFDYPVIHYIYENPRVTVEQIYQFAQDIITQQHGRFGRIVWESDRFAPQIDLLKVHHMDNRAKMTSLKALQFVMRADNVLEMPLPFDRPLTAEQIDRVLIPYNKHDVAETKRFALFSLAAIKFRIGLRETLHGDVLNWSDTKIGSKILEQRLGDELCYERSADGKFPRQTFRTSIALNDIIFPSVEFRHPEFNRVLSWMRAQTLRADEFQVEGEGAKIRTKGVFSGVHANVGGVVFEFGTGGIHASVEAQRFVADNEFAIVDIDVASLYPNIAIVNRLYPEHLGERFVEEYARLPQERKAWQKKTGKKGTEANAMKLASNGTYGNSNNAYSVFYDPKFTMTITINGQLLLCMLAEWLLTVDTLQIIMVNTDGITYRIHRSRIRHAEIVRDVWMRLTRLDLEEVQYSHMWIRDVNNYVARNVSGEMKLKGAYWYPVRFPEDIAEAQPPAWHKDFSAQVVIKAAVDHMVTGADIDAYIRSHGDPFDFMCRAKVDRSSRLMIGDREVQRITRYYVAREGGHMRKISPPAKGARVGDFKRAPKVTDAQWFAVRQEVGDAWDARIHTKNKSRYEIREMAIESGYLVADCNVASDFDFNNVNYDWYVEQARKLVVPG